MILKIYIEELSVNVEQNKEKILFLNSIPIFLKQFLLRCNYLLNNDILNLNKSLFKEKNKEDYLKIQLLKNIFKYPFISDENDFNDCAKFINEINEIFIHKFNYNILQNNSFYISGINSIILNSIKTILNDDKIKLIDEEYSLFSEAEQKSLSNIVKEFRANIIICGKTGPGKSSIINLILSSYEAKKGYNENSKNNSVKYYILSENSENNSAKKRYYNINNHSLYNKNIEILNGQRNINKLKDYKEKKN